MKIKSKTLAIFTLFSTMIFMQFTQIGCDKNTTEKQPQTTDTTFILPQYPGINDTVFLVNSITYSGGGAPLDSTNLVIDNNDIDVHLFYTKYIHHGIVPSTDTTEIGVLQAGIYFLSLTVRIYEPDVGEYYEIDETLEFTVSEEEGKH